MPTGATGSPPRPSRSICRTAERGLRTTRWQRKAAGLWGVSRSELQRWELMADIPEPLFEALLTAPRVPSTKALAEVARALRGTPGKAAHRVLPALRFRLAGAAARLRRACADRCPLALAARRPADISATLDRRQRQREYDQTRYAENPWRNGTATRRGRRPPAASSPSSRCARGASVAAAPPGQHRSPPHPASRRLDAVHRSRQPCFPVQALPQLHGLERRAHGLLGRGRR